MDWINRSIKWIMLGGGLLTCTMSYAFLAPAAAFQSTFGEELQGSAATLVVRNWGALITLSGAMLIYGAFRPAVRRLVLTVAGASKLVFVGLVLSQGNRYLGSQAAVAVVVDSVLILLFAAYLVGARPPEGAA